MKSGHSVKSRTKAAAKRASHAGTLAIFSLIFGVFGQLVLNESKNIAVGLLFFIIAIACMILADRNSASAGRTGNLFDLSFSINKRTEIALFLAVLIIAIFMRLFRLDSVPAGCFYDEALNGLTAIDIINNQSLPVYIGPQAPNNAAAFMYYIAVIFKFFGIGVAQLRLTSAIMGILAVPALYFLIRSLAGPVPALVGSFLLAVMRWHIVFSRIGFHAAFSVVAVILVMYFTFRAYHNRSRADFMLLGATLSFSLYTYQSARLVPFVLLLFIVFLSLKDRDFLRKNYRKMALTALTAMAVFIPLGIYIAGHFDAFMYRQNDVSIFNSGNGSDLAEKRSSTQVFFDNVKESLLMFNFKGDANERHNLPGQPELDFVTGCSLS